MQPKYELINSKPFMCVPCAIEMILKKNNIKEDFNQLDFLNYYELCLPNDKELLDKLYNEDEKYKKSTIINSMNKTMIGLLITDLNKYFKAECVPLHEVFISNNDISQLNYLTHFLILDSFFKSNYDIILFLNYKRLMGEEGYIGHCVVVNNIDYDNKIISLIIPDVIGENSKGTFEKEFSYNNVISAYSTGIYACGISLILKDKKE